MNTSKKFYLMVIMLMAFALALAACGDSPTSTPAPVPTKAPTTAPATTAAATTVAPTTVAPTTAAATTVAPTTAAATTVAPTTAAATTAKATTAAATTAATTGGNTVNGLGITITFPAGWTTSVQDKDDEGVLGGTATDGSYITIYRFTKGDAVQGDLKNRSNNLLNNFKTNLADFKVLEDLNQISDDTVRFSIEYTDKKSNTLNTEIVLVIDDASLQGTYLVEAGAPKPQFQGVSSTLVSILNTIKTHPAATATAAPATGKSGTVKGLGINITFPADWQANVDDKDDGGSITSLNADRSYINIFRFTKGTLVQGELKDRTSAVLDYLKGVYPDLQVIEDPTVVSSDTARFSIQFTDKTTKVPNLELVLVIDDATLKGTYLVEAGSEKDKFTAQKDGLVAILNTIKNA